MCGLFLGGEGMETSFLRLGSHQKGFFGIRRVGTRIRFAVYTEMQEFEIHLPGLVTRPEILIRNLK